MSAAEGTFPRSRTPTPEQAAAIAARGRDLLVEAGAGTGKTGTMVDRYCRLVCDGGVSPDAVLAFTFTDRAAAELRERIRAELVRRAGDGEDRARELLPGIGGAWVTTIHGFCNRLLAAHPVAAGIDPRFRVLDAPEATRLAREAFDEALEEFLASGDRAREQTAAAFGIEGLRGAVAGIHAELRSRGVATPALPEPPGPDPGAALRKAAAAAESALEALKPANSNRELLERAVEVLNRSGEPPRLDEVAALCTKSGAQAMLAYRQAIDEALARVAEAGEGGEAYRHVGELLRIFDARFEAAKRRRAGLDFEDLQLLAVRLLEERDLGAHYRARFEHILVDEFQDTNRLQLRLIERLRGPGSELMTVGDELQSIYGFRHADLEVFREQRRAVEAGPGRAMALSGNFRSRPEIVAAVNAIGGKLLRDSYRPLRVGALPEATAPSGGGPAVELLLTAEKDWDGEGIDLQPATDARTSAAALAEARFVAERLSGLADAGVERSRMVVLLRAFSKLDAHEDSLERAGLRPYVVGGRGYWSQLQVADIGALLATIANPLDDQALFGSLASPACAVTPDTLWLLRRAAGSGRHVWPALERAAGLAEPELEEPERLEQIPGSERALLSGFATVLATLRRSAPRLSLASLIDSAIRETGYDLAILMRPSGQARFANLRKLMRLATEFESREGRDLRGFLDFLAARSEADADAQAATALEGHDGVRIMTIHAAKGLEFDVVAVPDLSRGLLAGSWAPPLSLGREPGSPRTGMQLRRLGAPSINLYDYVELRDEGRERDAEEELRLFHVAATRARERLLLSGVVKAKAPEEVKPGTSVIERVVLALGVDREGDSIVTVPAPEPRQGLEASFEPVEIAASLNRPSPERAAELTVRRAAAHLPPELGTGPAPLLERLPPTVPNRPLSYTAIAAYEACAYRFYMERVLSLGAAGSIASAAEEPEPGDPGTSRGAAARGAAVHSLLEWSQANGWELPGPGLATRHAAAAGLGDGDPERLLAPVRGWLGSELFRQRVRGAGGAVRGEVPILLGVAGRVLRGSIDLLVEADGAAPLVIDYKTDRLNGSAPAERAERYAVQRDLYALAVAEAHGASELEVAYLFLDRPEEPVISRLGAEELAGARRRLAELIERIAAGEFPVAEPAARDWDLCRDCPALGRLCSGPGREPAALSPRRGR
jgi:ATP-dependent helicase/nuclease subunit A